MCCFQFYLVYFGWLLVCCGKIFFLHSKDHYETKIVNLWLNYVWWISFTVVVEVGVVKSQSPYCWSEECNFSELQIYRAPGWNDTSLVVIKIKEQYCKLTWWIGYQGCNFRFSIRGRRCNEILPGKRVWHVVIWPDKTSGVFFWADQ